MFFYAFIFFTLAFIAGLAGFNELAPELAGIARLAFYAFLGLGLISLVMGLPRR